MVPNLFMANCSVFPVWPSLASPAQLSAISMLSFC
ncbi:uncharacterized protein FFM5_15311 [Fusarium fujikuroi]|nr:uncharacterized protein FFM5_15311 [Fusarium fujikuroi]